MTKVPQIEGRRKGEETGQECPDSLGGAGQAAQPRSERPDFFDGPGQECPCSLGGAGQAAGVEAPGYNGPAAGIDQGVLVFEMEAMEPEEGLRKVKAAIASRRLMRRPSRKADRCIALDGTGQECPDSLGEAAAPARCIPDSICEPADAANQVADGVEQRADAASQLANAICEPADGDEQLADGAGQLVNPICEPADAAGEFADRAGQLVNPICEPADADEQLADGTGELVISICEDADGAGELADEAGEASLESGWLRDGTGSRDIPVPLATRSRDIPVPLGTIDEPSLERLPHRIGTGCAAAKRTSRL